LYVISCVDLADIISVPFVLWCYSIKDQPFRVTIIWYAKPMLFFY